MKLLRIVFLSLILVTIGCTKEKKTFTVIWKNDDQILKIDENVPLGTIPSYDGPTPVKLNPIPLIKEYKFKGWDKDIVPIEGDTVYNATFTQSEMAALAITFISNKDHDTFTFTSDAKVDWGDDTKNSEETSHTYAKEGEYIIRFYTDKLSPFRIDDGSSGITSLYFADFITSIDQNGFKNCSNLKNVRLPNNIANLNAYMFQNGKIDFYTKINDVYYLGNELNDHLYCFGTTNLKSIEIADGCEVLTNKSFDRSTETISFSLPDSLRIIGNNTFENCESLSSLTLPKNVESIGEYAFYKCYQLENIYIPNKVKIISDSCFENCSNLKQIVLPNSLEEIKGAAFYSCINLEFVDLSNIDHFVNGGPEMFEGCSMKLTIKVKNDNLKSQYENDSNWSKYKFITD